MKQIRTEMKSMREKLRKGIANDEIESSSYFVALNFYNSLESSVNALERPGAREQLSGAVALKARNVQELVDFMTEKGLLFAPANPGDENAYRSIHDACVRYARTAQASSGIQALNAPMPSRKK
jgi:hypothetical protein